VIPISEFRYHKI